MSQPAPITRAGAQRAARHELTKSIYHRNAEPWPVRLVRAAGRLVDHALNKALSAAPNGAGGGIALVLVIAVVAIVVFWRVGPPRRVAKVGAVLPAGQSVSAAEHRSLAERPPAAAIWHTAVIETYARGRLRARGTQRPAAQAGTHRHGAGTRGRPRRADRVG